MEIFELGYLLMILWCWRCITGVFFTYLQILMISSHFYVSNITVDICKINQKHIKRLLNVSSFFQILLQNITKFNSYNYIIIYERDEDNFEICVEYDKYWFGMKEQNPRLIQYMLCLSQFNSKNNFQYTES